MGDLVRLWAVPLLLQHLRPRLWAQLRGFGHEVSYQHAWFPR
jgi:hypothetical protein